MDEEEYFQQFDMSGMNPDQQELFKKVMWSTATYTPGMKNQKTGEDEDKPLTAYSSDIQSVMRNSKWESLFNEASNEAYSKVLRDAGISSQEWLSDHPEASTIEVLRAANYGGINEQESFYSNPENVEDQEAYFSYIEAKNKREKN